MRTIASPLILTTLVCGFMAPAAAQVATVPTGITVEYIFPPVGLGAGETASITVINAAAAPAPGSAAQTASCAGTISFFNAGGAIGTASSFSVGTDQFMSVVLPFAKAGLTGPRREILGKLSVTSSTAAPTSCALLASLEIYDSSTGATHAVLVPAKVQPSIAPIVVIDPR